MQKVKFFFMLILVLTAWFALVFQFSIMYGNSIAAHEKTATTVIHFFSYFTILTILLVALSLSAVIIIPNTKAGRFFSSPSAATALAVYITIVGLVYNMWLRKLWDPEGAQLIADELLHLAIPALYIIYWLFFVPKFFLKWQAAMWWLAFPFVYIIYILIYGNYTLWYPYPFIDVTELGMQKTWINAFLLFVLFALMSFLYITTDRMLYERKNKRIIHF